MSGSPLVYAHRGSSEALPEHTLAAYLRALEEGADGLECDVRLTRDGHLVCVHDGRLERTSNGRGWVSARTLAELAELDFGSWHQARPALANTEPANANPAGTEPANANPAGIGPANANPAGIGPAGTGPAGIDPDRVRLLTLDRLLRTVRDAGRPVHLLIETKHPTRYGSAVERQLIKLLARYGLARPDARNPVRVTVMSFWPLALRTVHALAPALPTALLLDVLPRGLRPGWLPFGTRVAAPSIGLVRSRPHLVPAMRAAGNQVYVWTVNEREDVDLITRYGVDGIITDRPHAVLSQLRR